MENEKIDLRWGRFAGQLAADFVALACAVLANQYLLTTAPNKLAPFDALIGGALILVPFFLAAMLARVPYHTDEFERRLRNWSMTQSGIIVLVASAVANLTVHATSPGATIISPYIMPALFLICHALYSQYLRHRIAHDRPNAFTGGRTC